MLGPSSPWRSPVTESSESSARTRPSRASNWCTVRRVSSVATASSRWCAPTRGRGAVSASRRCLRSPEWSVHLEPLAVSERQLEVPPVVRPTFASPQRRPGAGKGMVLRVEVGRGQHDLFLRRRRLDSADTDQLGQRMSLVDVVLGLDLDVCSGSVSGAFVVHGSRCVQKLCGGLMSLVRADRPVAVVQQPPATLLDHRLVGGLTTDRRPSAVSRPLITLCCPHTATASLAEAACRS